MSIRSLPARPLRLALTVFALVAALTLPTAAGAERLPRKGGKVEAAWPKTKRGKPSAPLARYLAEQVGARNPKRDRSASDQGALRLVRSFTIPVGDPSYARLVNLSFTYDSALAATAFVATKDKSQAEQLLDQLKALQRTDGSIDYAFDTLTGATDPRPYAGTIAWTGYAAETYRSAFKGGKYGNVSDGAKNWLISNQMPNGLVRGTAGAGWASTVHNLMAWKFLTLYAANTNGSSSAEAATAASKLQRGIDDNLMISDSSGLRFKQGLDDPTLALDAQTLGIMHLISRGRTADAGRVADFLQANFLVSGKSIAKSTDPATFNDTYASAGPFTGYRPYAGATDAPDLIWMEGTLEARLAMDLLGRSNSTLDSSISRWRAVAGNSVAPLMANRTQTDRFNDYHVWPASAGASWLLLSAYG